MGIGCQFIPPSGNFNRRAKRLFNETYVCWKKPDQADFEKISYCFYCICSTSFEENIVFLKTRLAGVKQGTLIGGISRRPLENHAFCCCCKCEIEFFDSCFRRMDRIQCSPWKKGESLLLANFVVTLKGKCFPCVLTFERCIRSASSSTGTTSK